MSTVTDPIADLIARLRNGARAQKIDIFVPYSRIKAEIVRILKEEGYITEYLVDTEWIAAHLDEFGRYPMNKGLDPFCAAAADCR